MRHYGIVLFTAVLLLSSSGNAWASLKLCNQTDETVFVAIAHPDEAGDWVAQGWWSIDPRSCRTVASGTPRHRFYYVHAFTETLSSTWSEGADMRSFCTTNQTFEMQEHTRCNLDDRRRREFFRDRRDRNTAPVESDRTRRADQNIRDRAGLQPRGLDGHQ